MRNVPFIDDHNLRQFLHDVKRHLDSLTGPTTIGRPTNIVVTPGPGSNFIQFTAGENADRHLLYISETGTWDPTLAGSYIVDMGGSTAWTDHVGRASIKRFYWVVAVGRGGPRSDPPTGPTTGTTLGLAAAGAKPGYVPPGINLKRGDLSNQPQIVVSRGGGRVEVK